MPQDTALFNVSIYHNISYGRPDTPRDEVIKAAHTAPIHGCTLQLPQGYETEAGERGVKLSGGDKRADRPCQSHL